MNFQEYWVYLMTIKPIDDTQKVLMSKKQFKNMMQKAFTKGFYQGLSCVKKVEKNPLDKLFDFLENDNLGE